MIKSMYPSLTPEERAYFHYWYVTDFVAKLLRHQLPLYRLVSMALKQMAVNKLYGHRGFRKDSDSSQAHYLKACEYYPLAIYSNSSFRKALGLVPHNEGDIYRFSSSLSARQKASIKRKEKFVYGTGRSDLTIKPYVIKRVISGEPVTIAD